MLGARGEKETFSSLLIPQTGAAQPSAHRPDSSSLLNVKEVPYFFWIIQIPPKASSPSQCTTLIMDHTGHLSEMINCASGAVEGTSPASISGGGGLVETSGCPSFKHCTGRCLLPGHHWCLNSSSVTSYPNEVMAV